MDNNIRAALFMMAGTSSFAINDAFLKLLSSDLGMFQIIAMRGLVVSLIFVAWVYAEGHFATARSPRDRAFLLVRSLGEVGAAFFFIKALFMMELATVTAIIQATPLVVAFAAYFLLREPLGWRRLSAIGVGFVGVLLIVQPSAGNLDMASIYALLSVVMIAVRDLSTRMMAATIPSSMVALTTAVGVMLMGFAGSVSESWIMPQSASWGYLAATVAFSVTGYYLVILAMRTGELSFAAPFRYMSLLTALVLGWAVLGEWPNTLALIGGALVVAAGVYALYRERVVQQAKARDDLSRGGC